jgi:hypothetical protein
MVRVVRLSALALIVAALAGCGKKGPQPKTLLLNGFERVPDAALLKRQFDPAEALKKPTYPGNDFDLATSGYATLSSINKEAARAAKDKALYKFIQGKSAAKVRFTVPTDYRKKEGNDRFPKTWETGFGLTIDSKTPLAATDWSAYKYLSLRVFNPGAVQQLYVRFSDSSSAVTTTAVAIPAGESELELPLQQLADARLNQRDLKSLDFYLDSAGQTTDPYLYVDEIALQDTDAALRAKLAADEGAGDETEDDSWDEEEEGVRAVRVVHPGDEPAAMAQAVSGPASAQ